MKLLGIDYGLVRTGVAVTDAGGRMAFPRCTVSMPANTTRAAFFEKLLAVVAAEAPQALVVGLPLREDGAETLTTRQVRRFVERLKRRVDLPVYVIPELLSTQEAEADLRAAGVAVRDRKPILDQQAAVRILESFLHEPAERRSRA